jgi:hypothetical protein
VREEVGYLDWMVRMTKEVIWSPTRGCRPEQMITAMGRDDLEVVL